jgi:hypothetical protein
MNEWFLVVADGSNNRSEMAYRTREHAEAMAKAKNFEYPSLAPFRVIPLAEVQAEPLAVA